MLKPRFLLLAFCLSASPVLAQEFTAVEAAPNPEIEAQTARELNAITPAILRRHQGSTSDSDKAKLAIAYANLGRADAGLRAADAMDSKDPDVINGAPLTRDEVRRIVSHRRAVLGKVPEASQLATQIQNPRLHASALLAIARAQTRVGKKLEAQKTLFEALKLVGQDRGVQMYIAVLLYRADETGAPKRILDRIKQALPATKSTKPFSQQTDAEIEAESDKRYLVWALLQTGQTEEAARRDFAANGFYSNNLINSLVRKGELVLAEKVARQEKDERGEMMNLLSIGWGVKDTSPERAKALAQEVDERAHKMAVDPQEAAQSTPLPTRRDGILLILASLRHLLGQEAEAETLVKEVVDRSTVEGAAYARLLYATIPFAIERNMRLSAPPPTRYSRAQIEQLSAAVNAALPDTNIAQFSGVFPILLDYQIGAGALEAARQTLTLSEEKTLSGANLRAEQNRTNPDLLNPALDIAQGWQKLGDTQHLSDFLNRLWNSPLAKDIPPRDRAWKFISAGFVDEGRRRLADQGIGPSEPIYQYSSLAYFQAKQIPVAFPTWLQSVQNSQKRLGILSDFAQGLTEYLFQPPSEREFTLTAGGSGYSISY